MTKQALLVLTSACLYLGCGDDEPTVVVPAAAEPDMAMAPAPAPPPDMAMAPAPAPAPPPPAPAPPPPPPAPLPPPDMAMAPAPPPPPQVVEVAVGPGGSNSFSPSSVSIPVGGTVRWVWQTGVHTVTSGAPGAIDGQFCSVGGAPSVAACSGNYATTPPFTFEHNFAAAGSFPYFCIVHGSLMTGMVTVGP